MARLYGTVWDNFTGFELTEIMRQQGDKQFADMLTRLRTKDHTDEVTKLLIRRLISKSDKAYPSDALHVFSKNALVDKHNRENLAQNPNSVYSVEAEDTNKEIQTNALSLNIPNDPNKTGGLAQSIQLAAGARVMITKT